MKRKNMEDGANCVEFNLIGTDKHNRAFHNKYCYSELFKNDFIDFMWDIIDKIKEKDIDFANALKLIDNQEKNANKIVNESERDEELKNAYNIIKNKAKDEKILDKYTRQSEFLKTCSKKYNIYLADDEKSYFCDDVMKSFDVYFFGKGKKVVKKQVGNHTKSIRHKPTFARKKDGSIESKEQGTGRIYFENGKAYFKTWDVRTESINHMFDVWNEKENKFDTKNGKCPRHKWISFEIYCNKKDDLQKQLFSNGYIGYAKLVKYYKKGKERYRVQINFEKTSPAVDKMDNEKHRIGINYNTETVAFVRDDGYQEIIELSPDTPRVTKEIIDIDVYLNNSRKATNPNMYNENGTEKYTKEQREELGLSYNKSNRYKKAMKERREKHRYLREKRKLHNLEDSKHIFQLGNSFISRDCSFKSWGMKGCRMAKKTKEKYMNKPRVGDYCKQIHDRAVGQVNARIKHLAQCKNFEYTEVKGGFKVSTYNHLSKQHNIFESLQHRLVVFDNSDLLESKFKNKFCTFEETIITLCDDEGNSYVIQRDLYDAAKMLYLIPYEEEKEYNGKKYMSTSWKFDQEGFENFFTNIFYPKHKEYIKKLIEQRNLGVELNGTIFGG